MQTKKSPDKIARETADILMIAYKDAVPYDRSVPVRLVPTANRCAPSGRWFTLHSRGLEAISEACRKLNSVQLLDFYPLEKCHDYLANLIVEEMDNGTQPLSHVHERLRQGVLGFLRSLASPDEWEVVCAVRGVDLSEGPFTVGPCSFYVMDDEAFSLWGRRFATGRYDPPATAWPLQSFIEQDAPLQGQVVAAARIRAINQTHARAKGDARIEESLHLLRYGQLAAGYADLPYPEVGLAAQHGRGNRSIVIRLDQPVCETSWTGGGATGGNLSVRRQAPGWTGLEQLICLDLPTRNDFQRQLTTALEWIGEAALARSAPIRLVALVTALEALLIEKSETTGKRTKLARRVSTLIADSEIGAQELAKQVDDLYKTRSECIHAGLLDLEKADLDRAVRFLTRTVEALVTKSPYSTASSLADILSQIDTPSVHSDDARRRWVAENAYFRWLNDGCPHAKDNQHWFDAEREYISTTVLRGRPLDSFGAGGQTGSEEE